MRCEFPWDWVRKFFSTYENVLFYTHCCNYLQPYKYKSFVLFCGTEGSNKSSYSHLGVSALSVQLEDVCCLPGWAVYCGFYLILCVCTPSPQTSSCCYRATQRKVGLRGDTGGTGSATTDLLACLNLAFMILSQDRWPFASHHYPVLRLGATRLPERVPCHL